MKEKKERKESDANLIRQEKGYQGKDEETKHSPLLDCSVQISSWTKLHYFTPVLVLILYQVNRLHDIGMM